MDNARIIDDIPERLADNEVFVYWGNVAGKPTSMSAVIASLKFGAKYGKRFGPNGKAWNVPVIDETMEHKLPLAKIGRYVAMLIDEARANPGKIYIVTEWLGGIGQWSTMDMAGLFADARDMGNFRFTESFYDAIVTIRAHCTNTNGIVRE